MPHTHSAAAKAVRRARAIAKGFIQPVPIDRPLVEVLAKRFIRAVVWSDSNDDNTPSGCDIDMIYEFDPWAKAASVLSASLLQPVVGRDAFPAMADRIRKPTSSSKSLLQQYIDKLEEKTASLSAAGSFMQFTFPSLNSSLLPRTILLQYL